MRMAFVELALATAFAALYGTGLQQTAIGFGKFGAGDLEVATGGENTRVCAGGDTAAATSAAKILSFLLPVPARQRWVRAVKLVLAHLKTRLWWSHTGGRLQDSDHRIPQVRELKSLWALRGRVLQRPSRKALTAHLIRRSGVLRHRLQP
jgi:hypothetical protein